MKLLKILDQNSTELLYDARNQFILEKLVDSERSVTELAKKLKIPTVTLWKRIQKLLAAGTIEISGIRKSGNLERKMYRATAARYIPAQILNFKPKDKRLSEAAEIYSQIQNMGLVLLTQSNDIPREANPADYALYANLSAFLKVYKMPGFRRKMEELEKKLSEVELA